MPAPNDGHIDRLLTNLSIEYKNEAAVWRAVMPTVKVAKRSDKFTVYTKADNFQMPDDQLGPVSMPNEIDWGRGDDNYSVTDHGLGHWLAQETIDNQDPPLSAEIRCNNLLNQQLDNKQEYRVATKVLTAGNYGGSNKTTLVGNDQWGGTTDDPIDDILTGINACFVKPNTLIMGPEVWAKFRKLPEILDAVKGATRYQSAGGGIAGMAECANLFEIPNWYVPRMKYNTAAPGQTAAYSWIWGKFVWIGYVDPNPGIDSITFGVTFQEALRATFRDFDGKRGVKGAHYFKVAYNSDEKLIATDVAYLISAAIA